MAEAKRRNVNYINAQNYLAFALAKNAWDEGIPVPNGYQGWDMNGFYKYKDPGPTFLPFEGRIGYSYHAGNNHAPILTDDEMDDYVASSGEGVDDPQKAGGDRVEKYATSLSTMVSEANGLLEFTVKRVFNKFFENLINPPDVGGLCINLYFAPWIQPGKFRFSQASGLGEGEPALHFTNAYGTHVWDKDGGRYDSCTVTVYEIGMSDRGPTHKQVFYENNIKGKSEGVLECKAFTEYYICVQFTGAYCTCDPRKEGAVEDEEYDALRFQILPVKEADSDEE